MAIPSDGAMCRNYGVTFIVDGPFGDVTGSEDFLAVWPQFSIAKLARKKTCVHQGIA